MKKILFIGNSFSVDTATYMHQIAKAMGEDIYVAVLYVGGCSLQRHWHNFQNDIHEYEIFVNGERYPSQINASILDGLSLQKEWDIISYQQWSYNSCDAGSYFPEITLLSGEIKKYSSAQFVLNETWSYAQDYHHEKYGQHPLNQLAMSFDIHQAYQQVSQKTGFPLFPVGSAIYKAREKYGDVFNRDGFHLNERGRLLAGLVWTYKIFGKDKNLSYYPKTGQSYDDLSEGIDNEWWEYLMETAKEIL